MTRQKLIILLAISSILIGCRKLYLEPLGNLLADEVWEVRPEGISCTPTESILTLENNEVTFNTNHMLCIELTMDSADFDVMRNESRFGPSIQEDGGSEAVSAALEYALKCGTPFPSEYNWYKTNVKVDGFELEDVAVRKKGFLGSVFSVAPGMILNLNEHLSDQSIGKTTRLTLNNNSEDASRIIQVLNYKFLEMAGYPAPRCNYANVTINGESLGVYAHIEAVNEEFLTRNFGNNTGDLYEGQIVDLITDWIPRWQAKTEYTQEIANPTRKVAKVIEEIDDKNFIEEISKHIDLDRFITFWALEIVLEHNDGYASNRNNFYIYFNPAEDNRITFIPWGLNYYRKNEDTGLDKFLRGELARRFSRIEESRTMIIDEINRILDEDWNEDVLISLVDEYQIHIESAQNDPELGTHIDEVKQWIIDRKENLINELNDGFPEGKKKAGICI